MKKYLNKGLVLTKKDNKDFKNFTKCWFCDVYVDSDVKIRDHCHITGKNRGSSHIDYNMKITLNHNIPIKFDKLKIYVSYLFMQELGKFNFKINVTSNVLEKYMSFNINFHLL